MGKLTVELIPKTVFFSNVRTLLKQKYWDLVRKDSYEKAEHKCEICGEKGKDRDLNTTWSVMRFGTITKKHEFKN